MYFHKLGLKTLIAPQEYPLCVGRRKGTDRYFTSYERSRLKLLAIMLCCRELFLVFSDSVFKICLFFVGIDVPLAIVSVVAALVWSRVPAW